MARGIAIVADPKGEVPEIQPEQAVTIGESGLVILVRHAQDTEAEVSEGDWKWATATIHVKTLAEAESASRPVLCDFVLNTPTCRLGIGDADGEVILPCPGTGRTRLVVSADDVSERPAERGLGRPLAGAEVNGDIVEFCFNV